MKTWRGGKCVALTAAAICCALISQSGGADEPRQHARRGASVIGPDVICSEIFGWQNWGVENGTLAVSVGTRSCNLGDMEVSWRAGTNQDPDSRHPVISQSMYRFLSGRFEQIGQSWLKHGFCAVDGEDFCTGCQGNLSCNALGVGCSDPYSPGLNGTQDDAGPKWQVNPVNGSFPYPPADPAWTGITARRLQIAVSDVRSSAAGDRGRGERYFVGVHYIAGDDALWDNDLNNSSYREVIMTRAGIDDYVGDTVAELPAIYAWQDADPNVEIVAVDVIGDGRFYLGYAVSPVSKTIYQYEYAVLNYNSNRAGHAFDVPVSAGVEINQIGFSDVDYHSGEPFDNTDWTHTRDDDSIRWAGEPFEANPNANALRWDTLYNFRFTSPRPPRTATVRLELFKPGIADSTIDIVAIAPTPMEDVTLDGRVDHDDVAAVIDNWSSSDDAADVDANGIVNLFDLLAVIRAWGS